MKKNEQHVITFKADAALASAIGRQTNRSAFIRAAVLAALDSACPLCNGTGLMPPQQMNHWKEFMRDHLIEECGRCHEVRLVCENKPPAVRRGRPAKGCPQ